MTDRDFTDHRLTEQRNVRTVNIDIATSIQVVRLLNEEDRTVADAVFEARHAMARTIDLVVAAFAHGGHLYYVGAGTSGRLGVLDASECPPTFGSDPNLVRGVIAGGIDALTRSQEGAEDDALAGARAIDDLFVGPEDVVVGIAASGTTAFVHASLVRSKERGAKTSFVTCTDPPEQLLSLCDEIIVAKVGPEALTGSTRLKAGTATKLILNTISTGAMIRTGKAYGNLMVDLTATSKKLIDRGERIVMEACGVDRASARSAIRAASGSVKVAVVMIGRGVDAARARHLLHESGGQVRAVVGDPPPVTA